MTTTDVSGWQESWHQLREVLGSKWAFHVLRLLSDRQYGFNEMQRSIDGVTATMLSRRLKELQCHGFVDKHVESTTPPSTTYELTEDGREFVGVLEQMEGLVDLVECSDGSECASTADSSKCVTVQ
ncbi:winged helix-turn-helix transcriptional regulator [Halorientalis salina]|uniref:winged helix-turn-helix transcriptional regulator n=1 Tax=Halorientalis salina TaxID=2932266 RepID=UPI0010ACAD30|nr:helix-turn-helix domain-containing protein [Halorientalis salina]